MIRINVLIAFAAGILLGAWLHGGDLQISWRYFHYQEAKFRRRLYYVGTHLAQKFEDSAIPF